MAAIGAAFAEAAACAATGRLEEAAQLAAPRFRLSRNQYERRDHSDDVMVAAEAPRPVAVRLIVS
nr:hypothetical protein [uncultured Lichenicoccus sp.]